MKLGIVIPWRETPSRLGPFNYVVDWYKDNFPKAEIFYGNREGELWSPSASRNDGVRLAEAAGCDILIVGDADSLAESQALHEAVEAAYGDGYVHNPFNVYKHLDFESTLFYYLNYPDEKLNGSLHYDAVGGIFVCTPKTWWELGGMDEKFLQWGPEDRAFDVAHQVIKGIPFVKHEGMLYSLAHQRQETDPGFHKTHSQNSALFWEYLEISNPDKMLELVKR